MATDELAKTDKAELVTLESLQKQGNLSKHTQEDFESLATSRYLPRLQLMTANSKECKAGKFKVNDYAIISGSNFQDVGAEVDVLVLAWRPKALEIDEDILSIYIKDDPEFLRIADRADNEKDSGCMWGYEYLVWVGAVKKFATFFCGSKSARREAPNVTSHLNKTATLRSHFIETKKYSWQGIQVVTCSTPVAMPTAVALEKELEKFNNPPKQEVERAEAEDRAV